MRVRCHAYGACASLLCTSAELPGARALPLFGRGLRCSRSYGARTGADTPLRYSTQIALCGWIPVIVKEGRMPRPTTVVAVTPLGTALERCRIARGMTRQEAYQKAGTSDTQWRRLLTEHRRFEPDVIGRAAAAVGMDLDEALNLANVALVPDDTVRVMTLSEVNALRNVLELQMAS